MSNPTTKERPIRGEFTLTHIDNLGESVVGTARDLDGLRNLNGNAIPRAAAPLSAEELADALSPRLSLLQRARELIRAGSEVVLDENGKWRTPDGKAADDWIVVTVLRPVRGEEAIAPRNGVSFKDRATAALYAALQHENGAGGIHSESEGELALYLSKFQATILFGSHIDAGAALRSLPISRKPE